MKTVLATIALVVVISCGSVAGQTRTTVEPGETVRVVDREGRRTTGIIHVVSPDGFVLRRKGIFSDGERFRFEGIESLELSVGKHREFLRTAILHTAVVAGAFTIIGALAYSECVPEEFLDCFLQPESRGQSAVDFGLIFGVVLGVPTGLIAGVFSKHDTWEVVRPGGLEQITPRLSVTPSGSVSFGLSLPIGR